MSILSTNNLSYSKKLSPVEWIFFIAFIGLSFWGILSHEIWLDEMHHYLMARDSNSLSDLYKLARLDWHPVTWNVLLYFITIFSHDPFWMQILHITLSAVIVFIVFKYSPFPTPAKVLLVFGYFFFYEYNIISRNYNLMVLCCLLVCIQYANRRNAYLRLSILLVALANTHYLGTLLSFCFALLLAADFFTEQKKHVGVSAPLAGLAVYVVGLLSTLAKVFSSNDMKSEFDFQNIVQIEKLTGGLLIIVKGLIPVPNFTQYSFWNSNFLIANSPIAALTLGLACVVIISLIFFDRRIIFSFFLITLFGLILFSTAVGYNGNRYFGSVFLLFIVSLWLAHYYRPATTANSSWTGLRLQAASGFIYTILFAQVVAGISCFAFDIVRPFSESKNAVGYLVQNQLTRLPVVVNNLNTGTSVSGYLQKKVFYPVLQDWGSYRTWHTPQYKMEHQHFLTALWNNRKKLEDEVIVVLNKDLEEQLTTDFVTKMKIVELATFDRSVLGEENCVLYRIQITGQE